MLNEQKKGELEGEKGKEREGEYVCMYIYMYVCVGQAARHRMSRNTFSKCLGEALGRVPPDLKEYS